MLASCSPSVCKPPCALLGRQAANGSLGEHSAPFSSAERLRESSAARFVILPSQCFSHCAAIAAPASAAEVEGHCVCVCARLAEAAAPPEAGQRRQPQSPLHSLPPQTPPRRTQSGRRQCTKFASLANYRAPAKRARIAGRAPAREEGALLAQAAARCRTDAPPTRWRRPTARHESSSRLACLLARRHGSVCAAAAAAARPSYTKSA